MEHGAQVQHAQKLMVTLISLCNYTLRVDFIFTSIPIDMFTVESFMLQKEKSQSAGICPLFNKHLYISYLNVQFPVT